MPYVIKPEDRIHIGDFRERPFARHAPDLQRILNTLRATPLAGRYVLVCTKPFREWRLARHPGQRGRPIEILDHAPFTSREEAEWAVFKLRWKEQTGEDLN
jgi:hypothetical protein